MYGFPRPSVKLNKVFDCEVHEGGFCAGATCRRRATFMFDAVLHDPKLPLFLSSIDQHLAMQARAKGCPYCGGVLHSAAYIRKPPALPAEDRPGAKRESFCCHTCRRRTPPMPVRYLGRRGYTGALALLLPVRNSARPP